MFGFTLSFSLNMASRILFAYLLSYFVGRKGMWYAVIIGWKVGLAVAIASYFLKNGEWKHSR